MLSFASLCTGEGLMDVGAKLAGFELAWGLEIAASHAAVARLNLGHKIHVQSIVDFDWHKVDRVDHLHISPPCTRASQANSTVGESDLDLAIARSFCDALEILMPLSITLENVVQYRHFKSFQMIVDRLWSLGYWVNADIFNSADFGVPQTRKRLIVRASKHKFLPQLQGNRRWVSWYDAIEDFIEEMPTSKLADWQFPRVPQIENPRGLYLIESQNASRQATIRDQREPAMTVTSSWFNRFPKVLDLRSNKGWRLDVKAVGRLQTLPDWFEGATVKGIGNGVPCLMAEEIMLSIASCTSNS